MRGNLLNVKLLRCQQITQIYGTGSLIDYSPTILTPFLRLRHYLVVIKNKMTFSDAISFTYVLHGSNIPATNNLHPFSKQNLHKNVKNEFGLFLFTPGAPSILRQISRRSAYSLEMIKKRISQVRARRGLKLAVNYGDNAFSITRA